MRVAGIELVVGQRYPLIFWEPIDKNTRKHKVVRKMKLVGIYPHHAQFEYRGIRRSYPYWDLRKLLKGEDYE